MVKPSPITLYGAKDTRKLNFPTITVGSERLRNPTKKELNKWMTI